ncbi:hypothetical protein D3C85_1873010 [compost metagenome]
MELREKLKEDSAGALKIVPPLGIPDFLLLGKPIQAVAEGMLIFSLKSQPDLF